MAVSSVVAPGGSPIHGQLERGQRVGDLRGTAELERRTERVPQREAQHAADRSFAEVHGAGW